MIRYREEARVALLVNPGSPTSTPENPNIVSQASHLPRDNGLEVAIDDCKRTDEPTPTLPNLRKGDMVEVKTVGAATLITIKGLKAQEDYNGQLERQISAIRLQGRPTTVYLC